MAILKSLFGGGDRSGEGVPGRAICRWARCELQPGERATSTRTKVELTLADGSSATLIEALPWELAVALSGWEHFDAPDWYDTEVPIRVDPATGQALSLDRPLLEQELAARFPVVEQAWSLKGQVGQSVQDVKTSITGILEAPGALRDAAEGIKGAWSEPVDEKPVVPPAFQVADDDPAFAPIDGVSYGTWVTIQGGMAREKVKPKARHEHAAAHGVPAGTWDAISAAWMQRVSSNPAMALRFRDDLARASQR